MNSDSMRQTCKVCGRPDKFDFHVSNEIWEAVVPPPFQNRVVCLFCFDSFAYEKNIKYSTEIDTLYFAGDQATFTFQTLSSADSRATTDNYSPVVSHDIHCKAPQ
jgi:hypothetical protein